MKDTAIHAAARSVRPADYRSAVSFTYITY